MGMSAGRLANRVPAALLPAVGIGIGAVGGLAYWLAALWWPSSVAVALALFATSMLCSSLDPAAGMADRRAVLVAVFVVLVKYDVLMALTSAKLGFDLPGNVTLGLVMVAGAASSHALAMSATAARSGATLAIALGLGAAPAALLGLPGLIGLAAALLARRAWVRLPRWRPMADPGASFEAMRELTELCFLLGALAGWQYV